MYVIAVMPAYNEEKRIAAAIQGVRRCVDAVVVVEDGSRDGTLAVARRVAAENPGVYVLNHHLNRGQGAALKTGNLAAEKLGADVIVHVDADGQHDPSGIATLIAPIREGRADIVYGSRFLGLTSDGMPFSRKLLLQAARRFSALALGIPTSVTDPQSGFRALTVDAMRKTPFFQDRMAHCSELLRSVIRSKLRFLEVPVRVTYTADTLAKGNRSLDAFAIVWQLFLGEMK